MVERIRGRKARKLTGQDKGSLIGEAKLCAQAKQNKFYFLSSGRCLRDKGKHHKPEHPSFSPPASIAEHDPMWDTPFVSWGQLSWLHPLPAC